MRAGLFPCTERLEWRVLLAHYGQDFDFGEVGFAPAGGGVLVADVSSGKILAVGRSGAARLDDDGAIDPTFTDAGATSDQFAVYAAVSGERVIIVGDVFSTPGET